MLHSLLVPKLTSLSATNEISQWDNRPFITRWPEQDNLKKKGEEVNKTIKKKTKRVRTAFTTEQLKLLENVFTLNSYIDKDERSKISKTINVGEKQIKVWFQNRRMKQKRCSSESSSDSSSEISSTSTPPLLKIEIFAPTESTYTNEDTAMNNILQPTNGFVESEYQLPNHVNENAAVNMANNFNEVQVFNHQEVYNYFPTETNYGYSEYVNPEPAQQMYAYNGYNHANTQSSTWYDNNLDSEYYEWL